MQEIQMGTEGYEIYMIFSVFFFFNLIFVDKKLRTNKTFESVIPDFSS